MGDPFNKVETDQTSEKSQSAPSSSSESTSAQPSVPASSVDGNRNVQVTFAKEDKTNQYHSNINQIELLPNGNSSNNTTVGYSGSGETSVYHLSINVGTKNNSENAPII